MKSIEGRVLSIEERMRARFFVPQYSILYTQYSSMSVLPIITGEDQPVLRAGTRNVEKVTEEVTTLLTDMRETLKDAKGLGLAAPQVGSDLRVCLVTLEGKKVIALLNPEILRRSARSTVDEEGCLSLVEFNADIKRFWRVWVRAQDMDGVTREFEVEDLLARVIQHEVDHLNGILCLDHVSALKRALYKKKRKRQLVRESTSE